MPTLTLQDLYPRMGAGATETRAVVQSGASTGKAPTQAPTLAWLGIVLALFLIRILLEMGAEVSES